VEKLSYVYIMASDQYGTLYIGVTSDLIRRVWQHRNGVAEGFTKEYGVKRLVWFEQHTYPRRHHQRKANQEMAA
jgi:putative endonuclease